jgi:hypothetical protein
MLRLTIVSSPAGVDVVSPAPEGMALVHLDRFLGFEAYFVRFLRRR